MQIYQDTPESRMLMYDFDFIHQFLFKFLIILSFFVYSLTFIQNFILKCQIAWKLVLM